METNERMRALVARVLAASNLRITILARELVDLAADELVESRYGLVQKQMATQTVSPEAYPDRTGFEAAVSKIHIDDFLTDEAELDDVIRQGMLYAERLATRLAAMPGYYRVYLSVDEENEDVTCRFHKVRDGEVWGVVNTSDASHEAIALWET